ncbi:MAG: hypothetical protein KDA32_09195 [Phycisphaerales bacterium]|nr:hypothetical protein [Phycisphaerales bacterium]
MVQHEPDISREELLDAILLRQAWRLGVDSLRFRSEKHVGDHTVVMQCDFDQADPASDRFTITFLEKGGTVSRHEEYHPDEIDAAIELYTPTHGAPREEAQVRAAEREAREEAAMANFPVAIEPDPNAPIEMAPIDDPNAE